MATGAKGLGANDPNAIDYSGHQKNFEDLMAAIDENRTPAVDGLAAMRSVEIICAIYESAKDNGSWINLSNS
jgi:predicted dehydrogenase